MALSGRKPSKKKKKTNSHFFYGMFFSRPDFGAIPWPA
jgi:hypothetical protein